MRLVCENHPTKAWPEECDCGPGMNDPVELLQESILGPRYRDKRTLMLFEAEYQERLWPIFYWTGNLIVSCRRL